MSVDGSLREPNFPLAERAGYTATAYYCDQYRNNIPPFARLDVADRGPRVGRLVRERLGT